MTLISKFEMPDGAAVVRKSNTGKPFSHAVACKTDNKWYHFSTHRDAASAEKQAAQLTHPGYQEIKVIAAD